MQACGGASASSLVHAYSCCPSCGCCEADSGTGNFVKIAQRIAVKITFGPDQKELARLSPGMSVEARLDTQQAGQQR